MPSTAQQLYQIWTGLRQMQTAAPHADWNKTYTK